MSQTKKFEAVNGRFMVRVYRDSDFGCFMVKLYTDGKLAATSEETSLESAKGTALAELKLMTEHVMTDEELAYLDSQAETMALQYGSKGATMTTTEHEICWSEAVTFVSNAEAVEHQKYRIVMFIAGHDVEGPWLEYKPEVFKIEALRLARAGIGFSVEFAQ